MDGWIRNAGSQQIIQYLGRQMRGGENGYIKSQISIKGSIHGARSLTSCEKANYMVCFQEAGEGKNIEKAFSPSFCFCLSLLFLLSSPLLPFYFTPQPIPLHTLTLHFCVQM